MTKPLCPHCNRTLKTNAGLTRHVNDIHQEMTPAQKARWEEAQAKSLENRSPLRVALESMVGREAA